MGEQNEYGKKLSDLNIPPDPNRKFFNCRKTNQNALLGDSFWIIDFHPKMVEMDGRVSEKYVLLCKKKLEDTDDMAFKFFTGSPDIKYKIEIAKQMNAMPLFVTLKGDGKNFDIV